MSSDPTPTDLQDLRALFGDLDIYVFDQLLRGHIAPGMTIFDVGCGGGRNLTWFLRAGYDVAGIDADPAAVERARARAIELGARRAVARLRVGVAEELDGEEPCADVVLCNAVLHFARDPAHFDAMLRGAWHVLRPGGLFFARLASTIGLEERVRSLGAGRYALPDGTERFLVDEALLVARTTELGGELMDPIKTTNVQNQRCMTTWVVRKGA